MGIISRFGCIIGTPLTHSGHPNLYLKLLPPLYVCSCVLNISEICEFNPLWCHSTPCNLGHRSVRNVINETFCNYMNKKLDNCFALKYMYWPYVAVTIDGSHKNGIFKNIQEIWWKHLRVTRDTKHSFSLLFLFSFAFNRSQT